MKTFYKSNNSSMLFRLLGLLLLLFCILKVLRGANTEIETVGGIWNYISLLYYPIMLILFVRKQRYKLIGFFAFCILYLNFVFFSIAVNGNFSLSRDNIYYLLMIPYPFIVLYCFYNCGEDDEIAKHLILAAYFGCLAINLITILRFQFLSYSRPMANDVYYSLCLFPFMLIYTRRKWLRGLASAAQFTASFLADKRAGFIAFCVGFILYILIVNGQSGRAHLVSAVKAILICAVVVLVFYYVTKYIDDRYNLRIYLRLFRVSRDSGSGRRQIYREIWNAYLNSSWEDKLFGHGYGAIHRRYNVGHAHNDFLEALYCYGVFAFLFITLIYVSLIVKAVKMIRIRSKNAPAFAYSIVIGLFLGFFSYFLIFYTYVTCMCAFWGRVLYMEAKADETRRRREPVSPEPVSPELIEKKGFA